MCVCVAILCNQSLRFGNDGAASKGGALSPKSDGPAATDRTHTVQLNAHEFRLSVAYGSASEPRVMNVILIVMKSSEIVFVVDTWT